jgi:hypothetical protein
LGHFTLLFQNADGAKMRTVPRRQSYRFFKKVLPRIDMQQKMEMSLIRCLLLRLKKNATKSVFYLGKIGHVNLCRLDTALMIVLCRPYQEFNMPSNRINDVFNGMIDYLFIKYTLFLSDPAIWSDMFQEFAVYLHDMGSQSVVKKSRCVHVRMGVSFRI